jgi:hypothetical protein
VYDLLLGNGSINSGGKEKKTIVAHKPSLIQTLRKVAKSNGVTLSTSETTAKADALQRRSDLASLVPPALKLFGLSYFISLLTGNF